MGRSWRGGTLLGLLATLATLAALATADDSNKRVVCYYTNWSVYRPGTAKFSPQNINPYLCTHLIYAFGGLTRENGIRAYDKYQDIEQGGYAKFTGLKSYNKQLKTMLAIGGWNEGSARFSPMVADPERRAEFVKNAVRFLRTNHFDGLDLDWEYPAYRDGGKPADRDNYAALVQELREEFDKEAKKTGRPRLLLTMAVPAGIEYIDKGYDVPRLNKYLDFMNILSYDYHSAFESAVNHHSPLYPIGEDDEYNFEAALSIDYTIKHYLKMGASRDKLVLGIPTYGRSYTLFNPDASELGAPSDGPGEQGDATREKGYLAYYEICEAEGWEVQKPHPKAMGPYAVKGNQWVGYDDMEIVKLKAEYVNEKGLGGIMFWSIDNDDFRGKCHNRPYPLIEAAKEALLDVKSGNEKNLISSKTSKNKSGHRASDSSAARSESSSSSTPRRTNKLKTKAPASTRRTTAATTPSTTSTTGHGLTTPEPPSTPDPGSDFVCKDEGFFPHPRDCKKYFWCLDSGPSNLGIVAHQFTCPSGLFFNKAADSCDYARNVICSKKAAAPATTATASTTAATPAVSVGRITTSTTTTTTTTEAPFEEEEEEEEEVDDVEDGGQEDPEALKELLNLIKKLGGVEELEKQLRGGSSSGAVESPAASPSSGTTNNHLNRNRSLVERVLQGRSRHAATLSTSSASDATTPRYKSLFRNGPSRPQNDGLQDAKDPQKDRERPKYVSIRRERPTVAAELEEAVQNEPEETAVEARTRSRYDKPAKREEDQGDDDEEVVQDERRPAKPATPEYITLRRNRPSDEPAVTTSRYVTLQRGRPSSTTEAAALSSQDEEDDDEEVESTSSEEDVGAVAVVTPSPSVAPYREGPVYRPTPLRTTRPAEDEEETAATTSPTTTTTATPKVSAERVSLRRPGGFLNHGSRGRRPTTQAPATTTTTAAPRRTPPRVIRRRKPAATTASPIDSDGAAQTSAPSRESVVNRGQSAAAAQRRRKFRPDVKTTTYSYEEATATTLSEATTERGRFSFPRRRPTGKSAEAGSATTAAPSSAEQAATVTASAATAPGTPLQGRELNALLARALQEQQLQDDRVQEQQSLNEADLSDLTHPAVVAIHTLATQAAATPPLASTPSPFVAASSPALPQSSSFTHVRTGDTTFSTSLSFPDAANTVQHGQHVQSAAPAARQPPRQHHTAVSLSDSEPAALTTLTTPPPLLEIRVPLTMTTVRGRGGAARRLPQGNPQGNPQGGLGADDVPRLRSPNPQLGPLNPLTGQLAQLAQDYEYYDDEADAAPSATKVKIHGDGWIECLDRGNFPHPFSCRKFISCAKMESGGLQGWEYTCPRGLSFDPIGGICNWSAGLGCKA